MDALEALISDEIPFEAKIAGNIPDDQHDLLEKINILNNTDYLGVVSGKLKQSFELGECVLSSYLLFYGRSTISIEAMGLVILLLLLIMQEFQILQ